MLITGGALRIGRAIALDLARQGAVIVLHYNRSAQHARALQKEIRSLGGEAVLAQADFARAPSAAAVSKFVKQLARKAGRIDVLVNNASIFYPTRLDRVRQKDWDDFMNVNLAAPFFLARELGLAMKKRKSGKIINLVDWTAFHPHPDYLPYAISKAGLQAATVGLARALAPEVQVNSIAPGPILPSRGMTAAQKKAVTQRTLAKRFGAPADIAAAVRFLVEGTDYVTGACIPVDGGSLIA
ncbi:MAG TPA: SDR family oxidoreductase [Verrucomicrobiae bacterium]|nr:SDR family oxidoreductase [Verrucomicrobiae bacterium]